MSQIAIDDRTHVLVLTGAGVSAESGIATFRGSGGLWEGHKVEEVASPQGFAKDPLLVWRFYSERRRAAGGCQPNPGHRALKALEDRLGDRFLLVTQNIDGLHGQAGSQRVLELHGNLYTTRCSRCDRPPFPDRDEYLNKAPVCGRCHQKGEFSLLRPHIVWFGENLDPAHLERLNAFLEKGARQRLVFLAAGTSGVVYPAARLVTLSREAGGETWLVNAEPSANHGEFQHFVQGQSGQVLPGLFG